MKQTQKHDLRTHQLIQCDVQAVDARFLLPKLLENVQADQISHAGAIDALKQWDYQTTLSCTACGIYRRWMQNLLGDLGWDEKNLYLHLHAQKLDADFRAKLTQTLEKALSDLNIKPGDPLPTWGVVHQNAFSHLASREFSEVLPLPSSGDEFTVNPGTSKWNEEKRIYEQTSGASQRMIVEMTSPPTIYSIIAGPNLDVRKGRLTHPGSAWMKWLQCQQVQKEYPVDWDEVFSKKISF